MKWGSALIFVMIWPWLTSAGEADQPWIQRARDLFTGDEAKLTQSRVWFNENPSTLPFLAENLSQLEEAHLALDTLVALDHREVIPYLLENLRQNFDGSYALALSAFLSAETAQKILPVFKRLVEAEPLTLPPPLLLPLLDTLSRLRVPLAQSTLDSLSQHPWPEVRSSLVLYLRELLARPSDHAPPEDLFTSLVQDPVYQVRLSALYLFKEFLSGVDAAAAKAACQREVHPVVQGFCQNLRENPK